GPLREDRLFFFGSYEGTRLRQSLTRTFAVPTASVRGGDFSGMAPVCDPLTIPTTGVCAPFSNNRIPASRLDPIATALLQHVPLPSSTGGVQNLAPVKGSTRNVDQLSLRVDERIGDSENVFARVSTFDADELQPFGTSALQE